MSAGVGGGVNACCSLIPWNLYNTWKVCACHSKNGRVLDFQRQSQISAIISTYPPAILSTCPHKNVHAILGHFLLYKTQSVEKDVPPDKCFLLQFRIFKIMIWKTMPVRSTNIMKRPLRARIIRTWPRGWRCLQVVVLSRS